MSYASTPSSSKWLDLPAMLDVEASGFGQGSYPIEVGVALPSGESFCSLIRPQPHWTHWDAAAEAVHGIPRSLLQERGRPIREVAQQLNDHLAGRTVYTDNWGFDYAWLGRLHHEAGVYPVYRLEHLRRLLTDAEIALWHDAKQHVSQKLHLPRHRASGDARLLQRTLLYLRTGEVRLAELPPRIPACA